MKHLTLFENFLSNINEQSQTMKSGAIVYVDPSSVEPTPGKMIASYSMSEDKKTFTIYFNSSTKKQLSKLVFTDNLELEHKDPKTDKPTKGIGLMVEISKTGEKVEKTKTILFKGDKKEDIYSALSSFFASTGAYESDVIGPNTINTILEAFKTKKERCPASLVRTASICTNAAKIPADNFILAETPAEAQLNKKLKSTTKSFLEKLG